MNSATARALPRGASEGREFSHVLAGVLLDGDAARLAAALDPAFLDEAGWDPVRRVLSLPAGHRLLGRMVCKLSGCEAGVRDSRTSVCYRCLTRLKRSGMTGEQIEQAERLPRHRAGRRGARYRDASASRHQRTLIFARVMPSNAGACTCQGWSCSSPIPGSGRPGQGFTRSAPSAPARARHGVAVSVMFTTSGG